MRVPIFAFIAIAIGNSALAQVAVDSLPWSSMVPGGIAVTPVHGDAVSGEYRDQRILLAQFEGRQYAIIGIPLDADPNRSNFRLQGGRRRSLRSSRSSTSNIAKRHLTLHNENARSIPCRRHERINRESVEMRQAFSNLVESLETRLRHSLPVDGVRSSSFGFAALSLTDSRAIPIPAWTSPRPKAPPILAPAPGVILTTGNYFFNGNTIIMDHGHGLISLYCHMNTIDVEPGAVIAAGEQIGRVGSTGRVTGPHLHWSVNLNNVRVDPALFLGENPSP